MTRDGLENESSGLIPQRREELLQSIKYNPRFNERREACNSAGDLAISLLAGKLLEHVELSNYVIVRGNPATSWVTTVKLPIPMND